MIGFPQIELHATKLKEHGIDFDRILNLTDTSEEDAGKAVTDRMQVKDMHYSWDAELEKASAIVAMAKEHLNEEIIGEIQATGSTNDVLNKIRLDLDPFYLRVDNPDDVRVSADLDEEAKKLPKGDFGDYCPITYVNTGFLQKGNPELEATVFGKTYVFAFEQQLEEFKVNPVLYLKPQGKPAEIPLPPPAPKVMILGQKGSGITTQISKVCDKYKLQSLDLKAEFMAKLNSEKEIRKRKRLRERGFRPPPPPEEEGEAPPPDPEIEDDPEDFNKEEHEKDLLKMIISASKGLVIDGTWNGFPEEAVLALDGTAFATLLLEARVAPELVILLKCKEQAAFDRLIDAEATKQEFERLMKERAELFKKEREADRAAKLAETEDGLKEDEEKTPEEKAAEIKETMEKWDEDRDAEDEAKDEDDPDKPVLDDMMEKHRENIRTQREADEAFLEEFATVLKEKGITVIDDLKADTSANFVFTKINSRLTENFQLRPDLIERQQAQPLTEKELPFYEMSYQYKQSKFGVNSPLSLSNPVKERRFAVLYRERIYYLASSEEQKQFLVEPSKFTKGVDAIPLDIQVVPKISVLGLPKSGKTTLCEKICASTGAVHLQMADIIQQFIEMDSVQCERLRKEMKKEGRPCEDQILVSLLAKRTKMKDCQANGWVVEDFPKNKSQAMHMCREGLTPSNVFFVRVSVEEVYKRTNAKSKDDFECNRSVLAARLRQYELNLPHTLGFFQRYYNSLIEVDGFKSKWFMEDRALAAIQDNMQSRQQFAKNLCFPDHPCEMNSLNCDRILMKATLSMFEYYCPVTWKNTKCLVKCTHDPENSIFYQNTFYYF